MNEFIENMEERLSTACRQNKQSAKRSFFVHSIQFL